MSHAHHEAAHEHKPYANALGIIAGLLLWWAAAAVAVGLVLRLVLGGGEPTE